MGPLPVETRVTGPPNFRLGANNDFGHQKFEKFYNNCNLVNNVVFKKLTTKLASMKYYETLSDITAKPLNSTS